MVSATDQLFLTEMVENMEKEGLEFLKTVVDREWDKRMRGDAPDFSEVSDALQEEA